MSKDEQTPLNPKLKPVYVTLVKDGKVLAKTLTYVQAQEAGIFSDSSYAFLDDGTPSGKITSGIRCSACGYSQRDFERTGRLGCAQCATTFKPMIQPLIERMHKGTKHLGKIPEHLKKHIALQTELAKQKAALDEAIAHENYEDAAKIRDLIESLEAEMVTL